ncbi:MAG: hypothetical protein ACFFBD_09535 [Candidatus Hodarchaeota archaeon]
MLIPTFVGSNEVSEAFHTQVQEALQQTQLHFRENRGQVANAEVQYYFDRPDFNGGYNDDFVCKINPAGSGSSDLVYSTFLGSDLDEKGYGIAVNSSGYIYVTGYTFGGSSTLFPTTTGAYDTNHKGAYDVFVCKLSDDGDTTTTTTTSTTIRLQPHQQ